MKIKNIYFLGLFTISLLIYQSAIFRIQYDEFDTTVYYVLLESLITLGKPLIPIVTGALQVICDSELYCGFNHPAIFGQQLFTQLPSEYTSGITLLFIPYCLNKLINIFYDVNLSLFYFIQIYCLGASLLYLCTSYLLIKYSKIDKFDIVIFLCISFISQMFILEYGTRGIVGEFYSSLLISNVVIIVILQTNNSIKLYYLCALFLGIAIEAKISIFPVASVVFFIILLRAYLKDKNIKEVFILALLFCTPKIAAIIYYFVAHDYSVGNLFLYFKSIKDVYVHNANSGLNWGDSSITKQLRLIFSDLNTNIKLIYYLGVVCIVISIIDYIINKKLLYNLVLIFIIIAASLIYPLTFKFPYPRIYTPFLAVFPLLFLPFITRSSQIINYPYKKIIILIFLSYLTLIAYRSSPFKSNFLDLNKALKFESFNTAYPNFFPSPTSIFVTSGFFQMPWDIYLLGILEKQRPFDLNPIYSNYSISKIDNDLDNIYFIETCRWGHCHKDKTILKSIIFNKSNKGDFECTIIPPEKISIYHLYKCDVIRGTSKI